MLGQVKIRKLGADSLDSLYAALKRCSRLCGRLPRTEHHTDGAHHCDHRCGPLRDHRTSRPHECDQRCRPHACKPMKPATILRIHSIISSALDLAVRYDWVGRNVARNASPPHATLGTALDQGKLKAPHGPRWDNLSQDQETAQLAGLREWVHGVLRRQYPGYKLPECWAAHREALWELGALHAEWRRVFDDPRGVDLESMLWFHERWLPGTLTRLNKVITCRAGFDCQATREGQRDQRTAYR